MRKKKKEERRKRNGTDNWLFHVHTSIYIMPFFNLSRRWKKEKYFFSKKKKKPVLDNELDDTTYSWVDITENPRLNRYVQKRKRQWYSYSLSFVYFSLLFPSLALIWSTIDRIFFSFLSVARSLLVMFRKEGKGNNLDETCQLVACCR